VLLILKAYQLFYKTSYPNEEINLPLQSVFLALPQQGSTGRNKYVVMQSVFMLNVFMLNVFMLNVFMLSVFMQSAVMLSIVVLSVFMLSLVMLYVFHGAL
jgi:hypothetical protein